VSDVSDGFDAIHVVGRAAVVDGTHDLEVAPSVSGRWGPSVVALPTGDLAGSLDRLTAEVIDIAGPRHWASGSAGRAHVTVRSLEKPAERPTPPDRIHRYTTAIDRALISVGPFTLDFDGVVIGRRGVVVTATSPDGSADALRERLGTELGADGAYESSVFDGGRPPTWHCSLVHFAGPIARPEQLVDWVDANRHRDVGREMFDALALCRWNLDRQGMVPFELAYVG
jgi:hypothetical protein